MATRRLSEGEIVSQKYGLGPDDQITGPAESATGLAATRVILSDLFGKVQQKAIEFGEEAGKAYCDREDCGLEVLTPTNDDALPSEAVFHCPKACGQKCLEAVGLAAASADSAHESSRTRIMDAITLELNPPD